MHLPVIQPFSFARTLTFIRRFLPISGDYVLADHSVTAAIAVGGRAVPFTLRDVDDRIDLEVASDADVIARQASHWISAGDDVSVFYERAKGDPAMAALVRSLHGLHQVRFLTLEEVAVYCVMMQRAPIAVAATLRRRFLDAFGLAVTFSSTTLRAFPEFPALLELDPDEIGEAIGNRRKGAQIGNVVRGVAAIGEDRLRSLPYGEAREALLEIPGVGPFSAAAILLRGLGRMDDVPDGVVGDLGVTLYGSSFDERALRRRYGDQLGYWSFYAKTGLARSHGEAALRSRPLRSMRSSAA